MIMMATTTRYDQLMTLVTTAADELGIHALDILGHDRARQFANPRQVIYYMLTIDLGWTRASVGRLMDRDHSTIYHGAKKIERQLANRDPETLYMVATLRRALVAAVGDTDADDIASVLTAVASLRDTLTAAGAVVDRMEARALDAQRALAECQR